MFKGFSLYGLLFVFLFLADRSNIAQAQNYVPNPSFENYTNCPTGNSQYYQATPWTRPSGSLTTPDYFNACVTTGSGCGYVDVPNNFGGSVTAYQGNAYMGLLSYYTGCPNCREYIVAPLTAPLVSGTTYMVKMRVRRAPNSRYATDRIGLYISNGAPSQPSNQPISTVTPQIQSFGVLLNTATWSLISGTYTAVGGENSITIGNFYDNSNTTVVNTGPSAGTCALVTAAAYYYIDSVSIRVYQPTQQLLVSNDTVICVGDSATIWATGDGPYWWANSNTPTVSFSTDSTLKVAPNATTTYIVNSANAYDSVTVTVLPGPPMVLFGAGPQICPGDLIHLDAHNPGDQYLWNTGDTTQVIPVTQQGWYSVTVTNLCGSDNDSVFVTVLPPPPVVSLGNDTTVCAGQPVTLDAGNPGQSFMWSTGDTTQSITTTGSGLFKVVVSNDCGADSSIITITHDIPVIDAGRDTCVCLGEPLTLNATGGFVSYSWSPGTALSDSTIPNPTAVFSNSLTLTVSVTNARGCTASDDVDICIYPWPSVDAGQDLTIIIGDFIQLNASGAMNYIWSPSTAMDNNNVPNPTVNPTETIVYYVTGTDANGCTNMDSVVVNVDIPGEKFWVPTGFTPNNDGVNDLFILSSNTYLTLLELSVYNRWGQQVFTTNDINSGWDGTYNGAEQAIGNYIFRVVVENYFGEIITRSGNVTLLR